MSNKVEFSKEQLAVINEPIGDILVSAAAGSGKTTVLVERIIRKILNDKDYGVDRILVMTFTREAASSMNRKIADAIQGKIAELSADFDKNKQTISRLKDQLDKIPNCYIQTIDSFCTRVIKEKSYVCADVKESKLLEPGNTILDNNELGLILAESADAAINSMYQDEDISSFESLTHLFGNGRTDSGLTETVVAVYKKLRSIPDYIDRCDSIIEARQDADNKGVLLGLHQILDRLMDVYRLVDRKLIDTLLSEIKDIIFVASKNEVRQEWFMDMVEAFGDYASKVIDAFDNGEEDIKVLELIKTGAQKIAEDVGKFNGLPSIKADDKIKDAADELNRELIIRFREDIGPISVLIKLLKKQLITGSLPGGYGDSAEAYYPGDNYQQIIDGDINSYLDLQKARTKIAEAFVELIKRTDKLYMENKARVHGMDFQDQEHLARKILDNHEAREFYKNKFLEIYIDEYQDNSELQDSIIAHIKKDEGNVFRVGDVKQSIYKFRFAKPKMFLDLASQYSQEDNNGTLFLLNQNHRSSGEILDFCNALFEQLMSSKATEIEYDDTQKLNYSDSKRCGVVPRVVVVNNYGLKKSTVDASGEVKVNNFGFKAVEAEVRKYLSEGYEPGEICILTRRRMPAARLSNYLNDQGLETCYSDDINIFADNDINGICNIIIALGNELRDEFLVGVLLSGYQTSNFTLDEVATLHLFAKAHQPPLVGVNLIGKLRAYADEGPEGELLLRVKRFVDWFDDLRNNLLLTDIGELVDRIYKDTGIALYRDDVLDKFIMFKDWLCDNFIRYGSDIATIAQKLENMKIKLGSSTAVKVTNDESDKITCMTMHSSKGLEFPCVIVCDLEVSNSDKSGKFVYSDKYGFVIDDYDEENISSVKSIERILRDEEEKLSEISEDIRLLYVALTRPKERLSIVTNLKLVEPEKKSATKTGRLYRSIMRQPEKAISRQHWISSPDGLNFELISALLRMDSSSEFNDRMAIDYCNGEDINMLTPIAFGGFELIIDDESEKVVENDTRLVEDDETEGREDESFIEDADDKYGVYMPIEEKRSDMVSLCFDAIDEYGRPIIPGYPYQDEADIPFKVSVSQIKSTGIEEALSLPLNVNDFSYYRDKYTGVIGESASDVGTFVHKILRFIDLDGLIADDNYDEQIDELIEEKIIRKSDRELALKQKDNITGFAHTEIGKRLCEADKTGNAQYEKPIIFATPVGDDFALVQGIIDCVFEEEDGSVIIDYKTDSMHEVQDNKEARAKLATERHARQIRCYEEAVAASGIKVKEKYIVLLKFGEVVKID